MSLRLEDDVSAAVVLEAPVGIAAVVAGNHLDDGERALEAVATPAVELVSACVEVAPLALRQVRRNPRALDVAAEHAEQSRDVPGRGLGSVEPDGELARNLPTLTEARDGDALVAVDEGVVLAHEVDERVRRVQVGEYLRLVFRAVRVVPVAVERVLHGHGGKSVGSRRLVDDGGRRLLVPRHGRPREVDERRRLHNARLYLQHDLRRPLGELVRRVGRRDVVPHLVRLQPGRRARRHHKREQEQQGARHEERGASCAGASGTLIARGGM